MGRLVETYPEIAADWAKKNQSLAEELARNIRVLETLLQPDHDTARVNDTNIS